MPQFIARTESWPHLPDVGSCTELSSDAVAVFDGKLSEVSLDGRALTSGFHDGMNTSAPFEASGITAPATLHVVDADTAIDVHLHAGPFLAASSVAVTVSGADLVVTWQAEDADSFLVADSGSFAFLNCRVAGDQRMFTLPGRAQDPQRHVQVQALGAMETSDTELGELRVLYGDVTTAAQPSQ